VRVVYRWHAGALEAAGSILDAHLRAWEYEPASDETWKSRGGDDTVRLFRTRRPDLAPAELWVGESSATLTAPDARDLPGRQPQGRGTSIS
jgi:hypothetical protein